MRAALSFLGQKLFASSTLINAKCENNWINFRCAPQWLADSSWPEPTTMFSVRSRLGTGSVAFFQVCL